MSKIKCVVTGGAGFIGSKLVNRLVELDYEVHVIDNLIRGKIENIHAKAIYHQLDIRYPELLENSNAFVNAKYVFHLAALPSVQESIDYPLESHAVNITGTLNILHLAKKHNAKVIFSSSSAVYGDAEILPIKENDKLSPLSPYALHKLVGEQYCDLFSKVYGLKTIILRYANVYGVGQYESGAYAPVIGAFIKNKINSENFTITGDGKQTRDFVNVLDVVEANILAAESRFGIGDIFNIGSGSSISILELAKTVDSGTDISYIPARLEPKHSLLDISSSKILLNWHPKISIQEGISECIAAKAK